MPRPPSPIWIRDGKPEVLWGGYTLMAVNGSNGTLKWNTQGRQARLWPGIVVADLDHNGIARSGHGQRQRLHRRVQRQRISRSAAGTFNPPAHRNEMRSLAVANIDTNSDLEIVVCSTRSDNQWFVYEHNGTLRPGWPQMTDSDTNGYAAGCFNENVGVADIDNDGRGEIIGPNDTHYAAAFNDDGSPVRASSIYGQVGGQNKPWARVGLHVDHTVDLRGYANCGVRASPQHGEQRPDHRRREWRRHAGRSSSSATSTTAAPIPTPISTRCPSSSTPIAPAGKMRSTIGPSSPCPMRTPRL